MTSGQSSVFTAARLKEPRTLAGGLPPSFTTTYNQPCISAVIVEDDIFGARVKTNISNSYHIKEAVREADLVIGAVLVPGARAPRLVTEEMVRGMKPGSVIVDVAIDQGGCAETADQVSTHSVPTYVRHGVVHYAVANIPGAVARTSTFALTNVTLPYALALAGKGLAQAVREDAALARGVNVCNGQVTYRAVAEDLGLPYTELREVLDVPVDLVG